MMKKYHFYSVSLGYSSIALVKIKSFFDFFFISQYAPAGSMIGKFAFVYRLFTSIVSGRRVEYEMLRSDYESHSCFILIPWSQSRNEKFCLITKKSFSKHSKSNRADALLKNEYEGVIEFSSLINAEHAFVQEPKYINDGKHVVLLYPLFKGNRSKGFVDIEFNHKNNRNNFFSTSYYKNSKKYLDVFLKKNYREIYDELFKMLTNSPDIEVNISPMHGDFSNSNLIDVGGKLLIIDFEEYLKEGIDIETSYYKFRYEFDRKKIFSINTDTDLLCVYHYIYFQTKNKSDFTFENIKLVNNELRLLL